MKNMILILLSLTFMFMAGCSDVEENGVASTDVAENQSTEESSEIHPQCIYEDDYVKVDFVKMIEEESIQGMGYIAVDFENKSEKEITIYPKDSAVDDVMVQYMSGIPGTMTAGKKFHQNWFFSLENAGIESVDDVDSLSFSLWIVDADMNTLAESEEIQIQLQ